jgi:nucleoside permease NupC
MNTSPNSIGSLLKDLRDETTHLLRQEVALAKTELSEKASHFVSNGIQIAIGGFVAYAGAIVLLFGLADLVSTILVRVGLDPDVAKWLSRAVLGIVVALIGYGMVMKAKKAMSAESLVPEKTLQTLKDDKQWAQQKLQHSHE